MIPLDYIVGILVGALVVWLLGGVGARLGGLLCIVAAVGAIAINPDVSGFALLVIGILMWLLGHWHYAFRHQGYKSPLARYIFCFWAPRCLDPTRKWAAAVDTEGEYRDRRRRS